MAVWLAVINGIVVGYGFYHDSSRLVSYNQIDSPGTRWYINQTLVQIRQVRGPPVRHKLRSPFDRVQIWPIRTLRWVTSALVSTLYVPVVALFLVSLSCSNNGKYMSAMQ